MSLMSQRTFPITRIVQHNIKQIAITAVIKQSYVNSKTRLLYMENK